MEKTITLPEPLLRQASGAACQKGMEMNTLEFLALPPQVAGDEARSEREGG